MANIGKLVRKAKNAATIEYVLVAMLLSVAALSAYANLGGKVPIDWATAYAGLFAHL